VSRVCPVGATKEMADGFSAVVPRGDRGHEQDEKVVERLSRLHDGQRRGGGRRGQCVLKREPEDRDGGSGSQWTKSHPFKVGFIYVGAPSDAGWTHAQDVGRLAVQSYFGGRVQTMFKEDVPKARSAHR